MVMSGLTLRITTMCFLWGRGKGDAALQVLVQNQTREWDMKR